MKRPFAEASDAIAYPVGRPMPESASFGGMDKAGNRPFVDVTYRLDAHDNWKLLREWFGEFGEAFDEAVAASTDGTVKVRFE